MSTHKQVLAVCHVTLVSEVTKQLQPYKGLQVRQADAAATTAAETRVTRQLDRSRTDGHYEHSDDRVPQSAVHQQVQVVCG